LFCSEVIREPMFWVVATASGLLGLAISFSSVWFLHQTGPTTYRWDGNTSLIMSTKNVHTKERNMYSCDSSKVLISFILFFSLVGSLNKIPISVAGILLFNVPVSVENFCSIVFGKNLFFICAIFLMSSYHVKSYPNDDTFSACSHQVFLLGYSLQRQKCPETVLSKCVIVTWKVPAAALPINCTEIWSESILSRMPPRHGLILHSTYPCTGYSMCVCIPSQFCTITISRQEKTAWPNNNWNCTDLWSRNWAECL
jgi:hypothetical protein